MSIAGSTTYSYKDTTGSLAIGGQSIRFAGQKGVKSIVITMLTEQSIMDTASDGAVMTSVPVGDSATVAIECQQTSSMHKQLLAAYNIIQAAKENNDVTLAAAGAMLVRNILDGSAHSALGMSFTKIPPKSYAASGQYLTWVLNAADCQNV